MNTVTTTPEKKKGSGNRGIIILLLVSVILNIILLAGGGYAVYNYDERVDSLVNVSVDLKTELRQTIDDLEKYKGISQDLDEMLAVANNEVEQKRLEIDKMIAVGKTDKKILDKLRYELRQIKRNRVKYEEEIDRLLLENRTLKSENLNLAVAVGNLEEEKDKLTKKVDVAARMAIEYAAIMGWNRKGKGYKETALAKKVERLNICFDVLENKVADPGKKIVYVRVTGPAGEVLGNKDLGSGSFKEADGKEKLFTIGKDIDYRNERQNFCMEWEDPSVKEYAPGTYGVEFYIEGRKAGATSFVLR